MRKDIGYQGNVVHFQKLKQISFYLTSTATVQAWNRPSCLQRERRNQTKGQKKVGKSTEGDYYLAAISVYGHREVIEPAVKPECSFSLQHVSVVLMV